MRLRHGGFSLVETIVSIAILAAAITGPLYLAYLGIRSSRDAKNELIATNLAAEALELVQARRNSIAAGTPPTPPSNATWIAPVVTACGGQYGCVIDVTMQDNTGKLLDSAFISCPAGCIGTRDYARMYLRSNSGIYRQSDANNMNPNQWVTTPYRRIVRVSYIADNGSISASPTRQVTATATVSYLRANGTTGVVEIATDLYNWFPQL